jgi:hypothetical protein
MGPWLSLGACLGRGDLWGMGEGSSGPEMGAHLLANLPAHVITKISGDNMA